MEAMLGETGEGSREDASSSSCDKGGTCFNGNLNGDFEDSMEVCNATSLNSSVMKSVSNRYLHEESSSIMDTLPPVASNGDGSGDCVRGVEQVKSSEKSDKVPSSESANLCRVLDCEVPNIVGKNIEHVDIEKTMGIQDVTSLSTNSVKKSEHSKEVMGLSKICDDSTSNDYSIIKSNALVNQCNMKGSVEVSDCSNKCFMGVNEKSIVFEVNSGCSSEKKSDSCEDGIQIGKLGMEDKIGCCDEERNDSGIVKLKVSKNASSEADSAEDNDLKTGEVYKPRNEEAVETKPDGYPLDVDSTSQNNDDSLKDPKSVDECQVSSSNTVENNEKGEDQAQNQEENTETKSEETSSKGKKSRKSAVILNLTPRRSSRNLNKQKSYVEKEEEPEIQEIPPTDPLADPLSTDPLRDDKENSKTRGRKNTIVVNDTKRLVEIATGSKNLKGGKKEPTLVIIDTNSILSGRGPVPVSQGSPHGSTLITPSPSSSGYSVLPIALPAQGLYSPMRMTNPVNLNAVHTPPPAPVAPRPSPPPILPTLTDDMYVVEAPSFIVPYVYEKPPIKPLKEYLEQLESEIEEELKNCPTTESEIDKEEDSSPENGESESKNQNDECDSTDTGNIGEKVRPVDENGEDSKDGSDNIKVNGEDSEAPASSSKCDNENHDDKDGYASEVVSDTDDASKSKDKCVDSKIENNEKDSSDAVKEDDDDDDEKDEEKDSEKDTEKHEKDTGKDQEKDGEKDRSTEGEGEKVVDSDKNSDIVKNENRGSENASNPQDTKEKSEVKSEDSTKMSYFDNPLGKFFMQIGINLVQEYVQTDLLRSQKRKRDREGRKGTVSTQHAINSLVKNLEFSKENNEPFHLEQKKCEYCSFKTESSLVMAQHLETPHMRNYVYRCNFCPLEVRSPHDILFHMEAEHNVRGRLERAPAFHQCPNCPFEDSQKGKLTRHLLSCSKKHKPERNQEPPPDWEPPAKIPRLARSRPTALGLGAAAYQATMAAKSVHPLLPKLVPGSVLPPAPVGINRGRGRPPIHGRYVPQDPKAVQRPIAPTQVRQNMMYRPSAPPGQVLLPTAYQLAGSQIYQSANKSPTAKLLQQPSISITPLPRQPAGMAPGSTMHPKHIGPSGHPGQSQNKATFVICEICDGYIKDLEQLRNHMQWIHKVKIHPKMIYNRPPLNCQKCQFRFFTDQGLERHLLGSHGLVTSSMQEAANKGKDGGRCPVCGRVYQWKLLNHVARDHNMSLKPAHLSYKCTVCTATFGMYKQFENHVYSAHSVVAKRVIDKKSPQVPRPQTSETLLKPLKINDEITIIPQPARPRPGPASRTGAVSAIMQQNMGPKRFKQRLQQKQSSVQVIELEDSPMKKDKASDGSSFQENGEDTLNAVKERLRRRKSLEISQVDSESSTLVSDDGPAKKRRRNDE